MILHAICFRIESRPLNNLVGRLNTKLISLNNWFKANKLSLNKKKKIYDFSSFQNKRNVINKVFIDNHELTQVNSSKYLGVIIDHKLDWIEHISYVKSKMSKGIGIMYKARQCISKKKLCLCCTMLIFIHI